MSCPLTQGYTLDCKDSIGGIKTVYILELAYKGSITSASGIITAWTPSSSKRLWTYQLEKESGSMTEDQELAMPAGTLTYVQGLTLPIRKMQAAIKAELRLLAMNDLLVMVLDRNGKYWLLGEENGLNLTKSAGVSGTAMGDANGNTLTFVGKEATPAKEVSSGIVAAIIQ